MEALPTADDRELLERWHRDDDRSARAELIERYLGFAHALARRFSRGDEPLDDLEQVAAIGLVHAIDRFDIDRDVALTTFAMPTIVGELRRHFRDRVAPVRVPRPISELATEVGRVDESLTRDRGRAATVAEIAEQVGRTTDEVAEALVAARSRYTVPLDPVSSDELGLAETLGDEEPGYHVAEARAIMAPALRRLDGRETELLRLRFEEELSQSEIAARLAVSQMQVSRLLRRTLDDLRLQLVTA